MLASRLGFTAHAVYHLKKPSVLHAAGQRLSFMIASFSLFAFVIGNMVGQHGWYAFWRTVLGKEDEVAIAFVGTIPPIERIPDYSEWAKYGGSKQLHTFNQAPEQVLRSLPEYNQAQLASGAASNFAKQVYSTLWAGGYNTPSGSHAGVDIDAPHGTPVQSIANGIVERVSLDTVGFGHFVMIKHPNAPDSGSPSGRTTLHSSYAHLDAVLVREGEVVYKGQQIGTVGNTGLVFGPTGYHLYFEIDRESAPYHPYWPFTSAEAKAAGLSYVQAVDSTRFQSRLDQYTLNPMAFVQQHRNDVAPVIAAKPAIVAVEQNEIVVAVTSSPALSARDRLKQLRVGRLRARVARSVVSQPSVIAEAPAPAPIPSVSPTVTVITKTASVDEPVSSPIINASVNTDVDHLLITHSGKLSRAWQKVTVTTIDSYGSVVRAPSFTGRLYVLPDFGEAEIRPSELSSLDFVNGVATLNILTRSPTKPVFVLTRGAFETRSAPLVSTR